MDDKIFRIDKVNDDITLVQRRSGLTFGTDAYLLYAYVRNHGKNSIGVDLGAGSGIISLLLAKKGKLAQIYAAEVQKPYSELVAINAERNGLADRVLSLNADVRSLSAQDIGKEVDAVFTNPPYMKMQSGRENPENEKNIARREVLATVEDFCACAGRLLKFGGAFYAVYRPERLSKLFFAMKKAVIEPKRLTMVCPDVSSRPSLVLVEGKKGGGEGLLVTSPLIMHKDASAKPIEDTEDLKYIYANGEFDEWYRKL